MVTTLNIFPEAQSNHSIKVVCACTMECPAERLFAFWRQLENMPRVLPSLISVQQVTRTESHWVAKGPREEYIEWDVEIVHEVPGQLIAWCTKEGFEPAHAGAVRFGPAAQGEGTEVTVSLEYDEPDEDMEPVVTRLFGSEPGAQLADDLRRVKAMVEAGGNRVGAGDRRVVAFR
ncbi:MAG TPA: SRPBCC family protein [Verrucomicrobiae bacterium]